MLGTPLPSHSPMLTWGERARGDRGSLEVSGGDKSWGQKYTESWGVGVVRENPPTQPHCWGSKKRQDLFFLFGIFWGRGAVKWGQRPETSNMEGASEVAGLGGRMKGGGRGLGRKREHVSGVGLRWLAREDREGRGHGAGGGQARRKGLGRREGCGNSGGRAMEEVGGTQDSVSPISSSHYLSSMNGFWHQRQEKQRPHTPTPPRLLPHPHFQILPTPAALQFQGAHPDLGLGDKGW